MDDDIYRRIADYNDWVRLPHPPGGTVEMNKLKGGKMKEWIEELKELAQAEINDDLKNDITDHNPEPLEMLKLIAEIESLNEKIGESYWVKKADDKQIEELNKEIQAITSTYDAQTEYVEKLRQEIEELIAKKRFWKGKYADMGETTLSIENKWLKQENKQLQVVREAAEKFVKAYYDDQPEQALKFIIKDLSIALATKGE